MDRKQKNILKSWKDIAKNHPRGIEFNFSRKKNIAERVRDGVDNFINSPSEDNFKKFWDELESSLRRATADKIIQKWQNNDRTVEDLVVLIEEIKNSPEYNKEWEDKLKAQKTIGELYGYLNTDSGQPVMNSCDMHGLQILGYYNQKSYNYNKLKKSFEAFKKDYINIVGHVTEGLDYEVPIILEIDQLFNVIDKVDSKSIDKEKEEEIKEFYKMILEYKTSSGNENNNTKNSYKNGKQLNTILYGPPGTGKTYKTVDEAVKIIDPDNYQELQKNRKQLKTRFDDLKEKGKIEFVTFHQSYGYEDFVEGIRPILGEDEGKELSYEIKDGIFKKICNKARSEKISSYDFNINNINFHKMSLGNTLKNEEDIYRYCIGEDVISLGYGRNIDYSDCNNRKQIEDKFVKKYPDGSKFNVYAINRFKNEINNGDIVIISRGTKEFIAIGKVTGEYFYDEDTEIKYNHFRKVEWLYRDIEEPVNYILKDKIFSQQTIYSLKKTDLKIDMIRNLIGSESSNEKDNYVLIIDEINRGNISKIFGELITLIEPDKRQNQDEELSTILPYSKDSFSIPDNLYIIGTMNTADRSIALIDTALRRRFVFKEIMPDSELLGAININNIDVKKMFETINQRIEYLYDRDHMIGHSYFLKLKNGKSEDEKYERLCDIFANNIIPLLQEYFYDNWEKIQIVLGDNIKQYPSINKSPSNYQEEPNNIRLIQSKKIIEKEIIGFDHQRYEDSLTYRINPDLINGQISTKAFTSIYIENLNQE